MKKMMEIIRSKLHLAPPALSGLFGALDNLNTAWHIGKALDTIQFTMDNMHEIGDIAEVSIDPQKDESQADKVGVVIVTEGAPSPTTLLKIRRFLDNTNDRFGTHLTARTIQRPTH